MHLRSHAHHPLIDERFRTAGVVALATVTLVLASCGDDDSSSESTSPPTTTVPATSTDAPVTTDPPATPATSVPDAAQAGLEEFCARAEEINALPGFPTVEQIEVYAAAAPEELQAPIALILEIMEGADGDLTAVFADPAGGDALEQITVREAELCGFEPPGGGEAGPPQDPSVTMLDQDATRVDVSGVDYAFEGSLPSTAGRHSFVMTNDGEEVHIMILLRLEDGATLDEVLESEGEVGVAEEYESDVAPPGAEAVLTADLGPGRWVLLCPIPDSAGVPHFVHGMIEEFAIR